MIRENPNIILITCDGADLEVHKNIGSFRELIDTKHRNSTKEREYKTMNVKHKKYLQIVDPKTLIPQSVVPLFDTWLRDTHIALAEDGYYYLTGTTRSEGKENAFYTNEGIELWRSIDLKKWDYLGVVWSFEKDGTWQKEFKYRKDDLEKQHPFRALYAPEIQMIKGTYYITASVNWPIQEGELNNRNEWPHFEGELAGKLEFSRTFLLKSDKPEGPYVNVGEGPLTTRIDSSLYVDEDGTVYYIWQDGRIAKMKEDMSGFAEEPKKMIQQHYVPEPYCEGAFVFKHDGLYHLILAIFTKEKDGQYGFFIDEKSENKISYDCVVATAENIYGPYSERYIAITGGGHNTFFVDKEGHLCATMFGNPIDGSIAPFYARPAFMQLTYDKETKRFYPKQD